MTFHLMDFFENNVDFCAEGAETERILAFCAKNGIEIKHLKKDKYRLYGNIAAKEYKKLRIPAKKAGLKLRILRKRGISFFIKRNIIKIGFVFGCTFIFLLMNFLNLFIWEINVYGNNEVETKDIILNVNEMGLRKGTLAKSHDIQIIEWNIMNKNEKIALAEVNIQGSCANIYIREVSEPALMKSDDDVPVNIVASRYGVIRKMDVFDGQDAVKIGDAVMKGDLLVSAVYEDRHNKLTLKHARANVIAETDYSIEVEFPLEQTITKRGNLKKKTVKIDVMGLIIQLGNERNTEGLIIETEEKQLRFLWIKLPINVIITRYFDVKENSITYNFEQGKAGAYLLLEQMEKEELSKAEIISRTNTERIKDNKYIIEADYICLMDIGEEQPIESDIPWQNTDDMS